MTNTSTAHTFKPGDRVIDKDTGDRGHIAAVIGETHIRVEWSGEPIRDSLGRVRYHSDTLEVGAATAGLVPDNA